MFTTEQVGIKAKKKARKRTFIRVGNDNLDLFKDQRTISATEAEGVTQRVFHSAD